MEKIYTTNSSLFPPQTREIQLDERWSFIYKKQKHCEANEESCGDNWDHTAIDPESRLLLSLVPGKRTDENCLKIVKDVKKRTGGRTNILFSTDEHSGYAKAIESVYGKEVTQQEHHDSDEKSQKVMPDDLCYVTVKKTREKGRVVKVVRTIVFGTLLLLSILLDQSSASKNINTAFVERNNGTERARNSRKVRKTYSFSKNKDVHNATSYFTGFSYNFCWVVRTLRLKSDNDGHWQKRTPAMAAGLTDHVWTIEEWISYPSKKS